MKTFFVVETTSTMDTVRELIPQSGLDAPFAVMCQIQTAGRGRGGSVWTQSNDAPVVADTLTSGQKPLSVTCKDSLPDAVRHGAIFGPCTFLVPGHLLKIPLNWVSLAVGCALADALWRVRARLANIVEFAKLLPPSPICETRLKWPNDVWSWPVKSADFTSSQAPKKVAGVLCESSFRGETLQFVSVGLGLNVLSAPADVSQAGSVIEMWGIPQDSLSSAMRQSLNVWIAEEIERELKDYLLTERSAEQLRHLALERSLPMGTLLSVNKGAFTGAFVGLSSEGGLLLEGHDTPILAADISFPEPFARVCLDFGNSQIHWLIQMGPKKSFGHAEWSHLNRRLLADSDVFLKSDFAQEILSGVSGATRIEIVWSAVSQASAAAKIIDHIEKILVEQSSQGREILLSPLQSEVVLKSAGLEADYAVNQLGVDRALHSWVAAQHAQKQREPVAVISVGTALTGLVVGAGQGIIESFILPGPAMGLRALHEKTARLPSVSLPEILPALEESGPFSTSSSLLRGISLQLLGLLQVLISRYQLSKIILTGGGARACFALLDTNVKPLTEIEPNLVLHAMADFTANQKNSRFNMLQSSDGSEDGLPERVLQSMLRARLSRRRSQRVALDKVHFRRLGGRLENHGVGLRLDRYLGEKFKFHNRDVWQQRVEIGEVMIEQNSPKNHTTDVAPATLINVKPTYVLKQGDQLWLFHPPEYEPDMMSDVEVVYDDTDAVVFCKPGYLVIHAAGLYGKNTFIEIAKKMGFADAAPVHRIDRETSGILVCARSTVMRRNLSLCFKESSVKKMYLAVTKGSRVLPTQFKVSLPIGAAIGSRIRLKLWHNPGEGLDALTHCVQLSQWEDYSLFACMPQTGRTNQIRVHLAAIGHWIVGDKMYHPDEDAFLDFYEEGYTSAVADKVLLPRHWLHNAGIQFLSCTDLPLGQAPVIAPLTADLMDHAPTRELLRRAALPSDSAEQKLAFADLFKKLIAIDFSAAPEIDEVSG